MAMLSGALQTYNDTVRREDLMDVLVDVSPDSNYIQTFAGTSSASQTLHEWGEDYIGRNTSNAVTIEGNEAAFSALTQPTRKNNICQIIMQTFAVSETERQVNKLSPKDAFAYQQGKAMQTWKNQFEFALFRGTKASGASGVGREMDGLRNTIVTDGLYTLRASGTSLSEAEFSDVVVASWNITDEYVFDLVLTTASKKRDISKFTANNTRNISAEDKRLVNTISIFESDFGIHEIRAHKDTLTADLVGVKKSNINIAYLRKPKMVELATTGDTMKGMIVGEATIETRGARAMAVRNFTV